MALRTDTFDLGGLRLSAGEGRRLELEIAIDSYELGGERYAVDPALVIARLDISRTTGAGHALRLGFSARLTGPCMSCFSPAVAIFDVAAREVSQPGVEDLELESPYVARGLLDLRQWARDALALTLPIKLLCRADCAGLCAVCGADLNLADADHGHGRDPDPRWAKLSELHFD